MRRFDPLDVFRCDLDGIRQIEASAGTGKTWNICGLYLRLLLERAFDVQSILVVTFTNAATAELRERIRQRIVDTLAWLRPERGGAGDGGDGFVEQLVETVRSRHGVTPDDMVARLELALATFDEASIFTIHGFCQRALADTPFSAQMPLALALVHDDGERLARAVNDFWRRHVAADDLDAGLAGHLVAREDTPARFAALLKRQLSKPMADVRWPAGIDQPPAADSDALADALDAAHALWTSQRHTIEDVLREGASALNANSYGDARIQTAIASWEAFLDGADPASILEEPGDKIELLGTAKLRAATKKQQATPSHPFFDAAQALLDLRAQAVQGLHLRRLALLRRMLADGAQAQRDAKRRERVIAFDDMLFNLHERLTGGHAPWLAAALKTRFPAALIDEFQDTDPLQFAIFRTIYTSIDPAAPAERAAPVFFVGDPKQAIYSFRNADLHTYLSAGDLAVAHYSLVANQRSTQPLIDALNALFGANRRAFMMDGLDYQAVGFGAKPRKPLVDRSGDSAALQVWALPDGDDGQPMLKRDADRLVVQATAAEIARLLAAARRGEITLGQAPAARALAAGDIAVLVRSNAQGAVIRRALQALGVGSVELSQASVFRSDDAEELDRVLVAILEPARDKKLNAALATEAMGRDAGAIAALADDEGARLATVLRFIGYRETWLERGIGFMLRRWLADENVTGRLLARADGERRLTNLLHLVECLHEAAQAFPAPDALLQWFQSQRLSPEAGDATQLRLESDQNLVQIVTIHKSKGLEYPIAFCPFLWGARRGAPGEGLDGKVYHDDGGRTVIDFGFDPADKAVSEDIRQRLKLEEAAETLRLVYVALTRAVHRCVLVAGCYTERIGSNLTATGSTHSLLNWLVAGDGLSPDEWFKHKRGADAIRDAWAALAERSAGTLSVEPLPAGAGTPLPARRASPDTLAALPPPRTLPAGWRIGSFSAIAHGAQHDRSGLDHDLRALDASVGATSPRPSGDAAPFDAADDDILNFPRGPAAGEAIHQALEKIEFDRRETWPAQVDGAVRLLRTLSPDARGGSSRGAPAATAGRFGGSGGGDLLARMLSHMLDDVLDTPLPIGTRVPLRLAELPASRKLVELEFHLPSHRLDAGALNDTLAAAGYPMPRLSFAALKGFLKGFIDLVFEHDGRYFILDWKSNHLGDTPASYTQGAMAAAMRDQGYHLQYLLYAVALDRYLRHRLPGYRPETHLGGAVYLFVRGVRPGWTDGDGAPTGVFFHRPDAATIHRLSALFGDERACP